MPFTVWKHRERNSHRDRKNIYYDFMRFGDSGTVKFGYSEKATQFEKIFHIKFDITE